MNVLCRDCVHCRPAHHFQTGELGGHSYITYPEARCALTDLVAGNGSAGRFCAEERARTHSVGVTCGPAGDNFEAAPIREPVRLVDINPTTKRRWWQV